MILALELQDLSFSYDGKTRVLDHLDLRVPYGCFAVLQGLSGSGKTTLLSVISGVIPQIQPGHLEGRVLLNGEDVSDKITGKLGMTPNKAGTRVMESLISDIIYTPLITFVMIFMLYLMGVTSIKDFALTLMCGLICGAYSSVCITGPLWYMLKTKMGKNEKNTGGSKKPSGGKKSSGKKKNSGNK